MQCPYRRRPKIDELEIGVILAALLQIFAVKIEFLNSAQPERQFWNAIFQRPLNLIIDKTSAIRRLRLGYPSREKPRTAFGPTVVDRRTSA